VFFVSVDNAGEMFDTNLTSLWNRIPEIEQGRVPDTAPPRLASAVDCSWALLLSTRPMPLASHLFKLPEQENFTSRLRCVRASRTESHPPIYCPAAFQEISPVPSHIPRLLFLLHADLSQIRWDFGQVLRYRTIASSVLSVTVGTQLQEILLNRGLIKIEG
jgi:hypothetical protein